MAAKKRIFWNLLVVIMTVITYFCMSFILLESNPAKWELGQRGILVFFFGLYVYCANTFPFIK
jgi:hypothetical protein